MTENKPTPEAMEAAKALFNGEFLNEVETANIIDRTMRTSRLIQDVKAWGESKGITGPNGRGTLLGQLSKTQEELTETRDAAVLLGRGHLTHGELQDGIGDCTVTLILAAEMAGLDFVECLQFAYDEIKGRTGRMENGVFVKNEKSPAAGEKGKANE